jgi:O-antigen ligase
MPNAHAIPSAPSAAATTDWLEQIGLFLLLAVAGTLQFSIAVSQVLFAVTLVCWVALLITRREKFEAPRLFWPLVAFAGMTLISAAFSPNPRVSFADSKQLVLFLMVPLTYRLASGRRGSLFITVIVSAAAASAAYGITQYAILQYDHLGMRPRGTLGHYMTYSGLLMLVIGAAVARILFGGRDRMWPAVVMPALAVAVAVSSTRSAAVGCCAAAALLLALKDFRLLALLPVLAAMFFVAAPAAISARFMSILDLQDATIRDRLAMLREGEQMVRARPLVGVGPDMVEAVYADYRDPEAVEQVNPHLHNVPMQIAAERGLPALAIWLWFVVTAIGDLTRRFYADRDRVLAASGLAAMMAMLAAGMFEHNFGDSEFLMLLLLLITLPFAATRHASSDARG